MREDNSHQTMMKRKGSSLFCAVAEITVCISVALVVWVVYSGSTAIPDHLSSRSPNTLLTPEGVHQLAARTLPMFFIDKQTYRPEDDMLVSLFSLNGFDYTPDAARHQDWKLQIIGPKGDVARSQTIHRHGSPSVSLRGLAGGAYSVKAVPKALRPWDDHQLPYFATAPTAIRNFTISEYYTPSMLLQVEFKNASYKENDIVVATVELERSRGGVPYGAEMIVDVASSGGGSIFQQKLVVSSGRVQLEFPLTIPPVSNGASDAQPTVTLSVTVHDGGVTESTVKTVPLIGKAIPIDVRFYPEGGDLVEGTAMQRLFVEARSGPSLTLPVHVRVEIADEGRSANDPLRSVICETHESGRGSCEIPFAVEANSKIVAKILTAPWQDTRVALPEVQPVEDKSVGCRRALKIQRSVLTAGESLHVSVGPGHLPVTVSIWKRDVRVAIAKVPRSAMWSDVIVPLSHCRVQSLNNSICVGVLRVVIEGDNNNPVAERLVFLRPSSTLQVIVKAPVSVHPGELSEITVSAPGSGEGAVAFQTSIINAALWNKIPEKERHPRIAVQALLEPEIWEASTPSKILLSDDGEALPTAELELLLGVQGWRRHVFKKITQPLTPDDRTTRVVAPVTLSPQYEIEYDHSPSKKTPSFAGKILSWLSIPAAFLVALAGFAALLRSNNVTLRCVGVLMLLLGWGLVFFVNEQHSAAVPTVSSPMRPVRRMVAQHGAVAENVAFAAADVQMAFGAPLKAARVLRRKAVRNAAVREGAVQFDNAGVAEVAAAGGVADAAAPPVAGVEKYRDPSSKPSSADHVEVRKDFRDTAHFSANILRDNSIKIPVVFPDSIGTYLLLADVVGSNGLIGQAFATIVCKRAFFTDIKIPPIVVEGDAIAAPLNIVSTGSHGEVKVDARITAANGDVTSASFSQPVVKESSRLSIPVMAQRAHNGLCSDCSATSKFEITAALTDGQKKVHRDALSREFNVLPRGFQLQVSRSGQCDPNSNSSLEFEIPASLSPNTAVSIVALAQPTIFGTLQTSLSGMLREPYGCFEQTSSTTYPNIMILQFLASTGASPLSEDSKRAKELIAKGYARLMSYESKSNGFEWFGGDPGHEALTSYGLMEFNDMAQVTDALVDRAMLKRTSAWLLSRRDGNGRFRRNSQALDSFGRADDDTTAAYIIWALSHVPEARSLLDTEFSWIESLLNRSDANEPSLYIAALASHALLLAGKRSSSALNFAQRLKASLATDGSIHVPVGTSITLSTGKSLDIETTSLAVLAFLASDDNDFRALVPSMISWLLSTCTGGMFGSTQSTILALKAIVAYSATQQLSSERQSGEIALEIDGVVVKSFPVTKDQSGMIRLEASIAYENAKGKHVALVKLSGGQKIPVSITISYAAETPLSCDNCTVSLHTSIDRSTAAEGETVRITTRTQNIRDTPLGMVVSNIGIPAGLDLRMDQLKELVQSGAIDFFEVRGLILSLYWRAMKPLQSNEVSISCIAAVPGQYRAPASSSYVYYDHFQRNWVDPLSVQISASSQ